MKYLRHLQGEVSALRRALPLQLGDDLMPRRQRLFLPSFVPSLSSLTLPTRVLRGDQLQDMWEVVSSMQCATAAL